jgi:steroid delta-isomerase-like uncharacterized protein
MSLEENKAVVLRNYEQLNRGNLVGAVDELYAEEFSLHVPGLPEPVRGREAFKEFVTAFFLNAFPDLRETAEDLIAEGDRVAIRESYQGTHTGEFQGLAPTGRVVRFTSTDIYRIVDGKIVEVWTELDALGMLQQLGAIPGSAQVT